MRRRYAFRVPVARLREDVLAGLSAAEIGRRHPRPDGHPWPAAVVRTACRDHGLPIPRLRDPHPARLGCALATELPLHDCARACGISVTELLVLARSRGLPVTPDGRAVLRRPSSARVARRRERAGPLFELLEAAA